MSTRTDFSILYTDDMEQEHEMGTPRAERTVASMEAAGYDRRIGLIAEGLRDLAAQIERDGRLYDRGASFDGTPAFVNAASRVMHSLMWGIANLNADALIDAAGRADRAAADEAAEIARVESTA